MGSQNEISNKAHMNNLFLTVEFYQSVNENVVSGIMFKKNKASQEQRNTFRYCEIKLQRNQCPQTSVRRQSEDGPPLLSRLHAAPCAFYTSAALNQLERADKKPQNLILVKLK